MAHWFQLKREKGNLIPPEVEETALLGGGVSHQIPSLGKAETREEARPMADTSSPGAAVGPDSRTE